MVAWFMEHHGTAGQELITSLTACLTNSIQYHCLALKEVHNLIRMVGSFCEGIFSVLFSACFTRKHRAIGE